MPRLSLRFLTHLLYVAGFFGLLSMPLLTHNRTSDTGIMAAEKRQPAPEPTWPKTGHDALEWPKLVDGYLADHFGGRTAMVMAFNHARYRLFGETPTEQTIFGRKHRLFLTSDGASTPYTLLGFICGIGVADPLLDQAATDLSAFLRQIDSIPAANYVMAVPTAPALYPEDLPRWLRDRCQGPNAMDRLLPRLAQDAHADHLIYPLAAMQAAKSAGEVIPRSNFHWHGLGAAAAAKYFAETTLGLTPHFTLPVHEQVEPSDIAQMIPGVPTGSSVRDPDYAAVGADYCWGAACFPEMGATAAMIYDLSHLRSPRGGDKKLLILSDSFGLGIVGWFAPYFSEVRHFSVSTLWRLSPAERDAFRQQIFTDYKPDMVLYLFHDGSVHYWPASTTKGIWGPA